MVLKNLKVGDVFHFADDNAEKELLVYHIIDTIMEFNSLYGTHKFCTNLEWDYMGEREVIKLYTKSY